MRRLLLLPFGVLHLSCFVVGQDHGSDLVVLRSLQPFATPSLQVAGGPWSALSDDRTHSEVPRQLDALAPESVVTWPVEILDERYRADIDGGRLQLHQGQRANPSGDGLVWDNNLLVQGQPAVVAACLRDLDAMAECVSRSIEITAWRLAVAPGALPPSTWSPDLLRQRLANTPAVWTAKTHTRSGAAVRLGQERWIHYVRDLDVEVAEKAHIEDPKVDAAFAGLRVALSAHELPNDTIVLRGQWLLSEAVAMHEQPTGANQPTVDEPEHRTVFATFAGRVPSGGALVVSGRGGSVGPEGFVLVVSARFTRPPATDPAPDLWVRPIDAFRSDIDLPMPGWYALPLSHDEIPVRSPAGLSVDLLTHTFASNAGSATRLVGDDRIVVANGNEALCSRARLTLLQLTEQLRGAELRSTARPAKAGSADSLELVQPLLIGFRTAAFVGTERAVIRDYEVEIAAKAEAGNPVINIARSGLAVHVLTSAVGDTPHVEGLWTLTAQGPLRLHEHAGVMPMAMQLADYRTAAFPWDARMTVNQEHVLGDGPPWTADGAPTQVTVQLLR